MNIDLTIKRVSTEWDDFAKEAMLLGNQGYDKTCEAYFSCEDQTFFAKSTELDNVGLSEDQFKSLVEDTINDIEDEEESDNFTLIFLNGTLNEAVFEVKTPNGSFIMSFPQ